MSTDLRYIFELEEAINPETVVRVLEYIEQANRRMEMITSELLEILEDKYFEEHPFDGIGDFAKWLNEYYPGLVEELL